MKCYIKLNNEWVEPSVVYRKENGVWVPISGNTLQQYLAQNPTFYGGHLYHHQFSIGGNDNFTGESCSFIALFDKETDVTTASTWTIISGSEYAEITSGTGEVTVLSAASTSEVIIQASYSGSVATKTVILTYESGTTSQTETEIEINESGDTVVTTTTTTTDASGGSVVQSETVITDPSGNTIGSQTSIVSQNPDGSSTGQTRNYDENGMLTDGKNTSGDTEGNVSTQSVEYDSAGTPTVVGFVIDTSSNTGGTKDIEGNGIDTEFVPFKFANDGFIVHIRFRTVASEQPRPPITPDTEDSGSNYLYTILGAKTTAKVGNVWPGFEISWAISKSGDGTSGDLQFKRTLSGETASTKTSFASQHDGNNVYDLTITYNPNLSTNKFVVYNNIKHSNIQTSNNKIQDNVNLDMTIGYSFDHLGDAIRHSNVQIYEFTVNKL